MIIEIHLKLVITITYTLEDNNVFNWVSFYGDMVIGRGLNSYDFPNFKFGFIELKGGLKNKWKKY